MAFSSGSQAWPGSKTTRKKIFERNPSPLLEILILWVWNEAQDTVFLYVSPKWQRKVAGSNKCPWHWSHSFLSPSDNPVSSKFQNPWDHLILLSLSRRTQIRLFSSILHGSLPHSWEPPKCWNLQLVHKSHRASKEVIWFWQNSKLKYRNSSLSKLLETNVKHRSRKAKGSLLKQYTKLLLKEKLQFFWICLTKA